MRGYLRRQLRADGVLNPRARNVRWLGHLVGVALLILMAYAIASAIIVDASGTGKF